MKHFIDRMTGEIFAYEADGSQDDFIRQELEPLSDKELAEIRADQELASSPTKEQLAIDALAKRDELLSKAALRIDPLQDKIDLGSATDEGIILLMEWKKYRVAVNECDEQPGFPQTVVWPTEPS